MFSSNEEQRLASRYVAQWLESAINGGLELYHEQAKLNLNPDLAPEDTTEPLMERDSGADYLND